jgi:RimJ/RimL family protein N-acetyltransferase
MPPRAHTRGSTRAFEELGVRRVVASTMVVNIASRRVLEKAGLRFVRTFHQPWPDHLDGEEKGDVEYALPRSEWQQQVATGNPECSQPHITRAMPRRSSAAPRA